MSGRLRMRVVTLEKRVRAEGACRVCGGKTRLKILLGDEEPLPEPCHRCGREWRVVRIIRGTPPEGWEQRSKKSPDA
jgi:hypothetical protein